MVKPYNTNTAHLICSHPWNGSNCFRIPLDPFAQFLFCNCKFTFWQRSLNCLERQKNPYNQCLTLWERRWFCMSKLVPWRKGSLDVEWRRDARHIAGAYVDCDRQCLQMNGHHSTSVSMGIDFSLMTRVVQNVIFPRILTKTQTAASNETSMSLLAESGRNR